MKKNPYLLPSGLFSVSSFAEYTIEYDQIIAVPSQGVSSQDDTKQNPAEDGDEIAVLPLTTQEKIDEQEPDETSEDEDDDDDDDEDDKLASVWLN
ncbi:MAG: hypothetical protein AB8G77_26045 [Rhodothermales bacterium]